MVYITLNELRDILPIILERWIDEDDESWEWIFQEIEQKCHIGTKCKGKKGKKWKKHIEDDIYQLKSMVDTHSVVISAHRNDIDVLKKRVDELSNKVSNLSSSDVSMESRINTLSHDVAATKSLAETAKRRTEVDYTQMSKVKNDMKDNCVFVELQKYDALEKKEIPVKKIEVDCQTCKHVDKYPNCPDCGNNYSAWEAKDNG